MMQTEQQNKKRGISWMMQHKGAVALGVVVLGGGYWWYYSTHASTSAVRYVTRAVERGSLTAAVTASGNMMVDQEANIDPSIGGTVANLSVHAGDGVKKGKLLFTIANDQLDVSLANASSSLLKANNALVSAHITKDQARDAYRTATRSNASSSPLTKSTLKQKIDVAEQAIVIADQDRRAAQLSYQKARSDALKRRVTSPIDGTVNEINIKNGDDLANISSGSSRLTPMIIGDLTTLKAEVLVNEVDITRVSIGQKAVLTFAALGTKTVTGKVEKIDSLGSVTQGVVTYRVIVGLDVNESDIKPGMSVSAALITDVKQDVLMVPSSAIKVNQQGEASVEVLKSGGVPEQRSVVVGITNGTNTEIVSGVSEGENSVTQTINPAAAASTSTSSALRIPGVGGGRLRGD